MTEEKNNAKIAEIKASLKQQQTKMGRLNELSDEFTVKAPADGMVIYARSWEGKVTSGSRLRAWDPVVAELPDLTEMVSKTYVNEVDISKVYTGQEATVSVDAFPDKKYTGTVTKVANIGEKLRDYDTKVFEVQVTLNEQDSILRPAMTTGIEILINKYDTTTYIPLEAVFKDSIDYVFLKNGSKISKHEVLLGKSNDIDIMVIAGINEFDEVLLNQPEDPEKIKTNFLDDKIKTEKRQAFEAKNSQEIKEKKKAENPTERKRGKGKFSKSGKRPV